MGVVKRQGLKNTISSYLGIVLGFVSLLLIQPKFLTTEEIGLARVLFSFSTLIASIIPLGVSNLTIKYFPLFKNEEKRHHGFFGFMMLFPLAGCILTALVLYVFKSAIVARYSRESLLFTEFYDYVLPFSLLIGLTSVITFYLSSLFKSSISSYTNDVLVRVLFIGLILIYFNRWISLDQFVLGYVGIYLLQLSVLLFYLLKVDKPGFKVDWEFFKKNGVGDMVKFGLVVSLAGFASMGLTTLDSIMLAETGLKIVGVYSVVAFIPTIIQTPLVALDKITSTKIAHALADNNLDEIRDIYFKSVKYLLIIGGLLFVGINTNIAYLLGFLEKDFSSALPIVPVLSLGYLFNMGGGTNTNILFFSVKYWQAALMFVAAFLLTFGLNLLLIPDFGMMGVAISIATTAIVYTTFKSWWVWKKFGLQPYDLNVLKILLVIAVSYLITVLIPSLDSNLLNIAVHAPVGFILFVGGVYVLRIAPELFDLSFYKLFTN